MKNYARTVTPAFKISNKNLESKNTRESSELLSTKRDKGISKRDTMKKPIINLVPATFGEDLPVISPDQTSNGGEVSHSNASQKGKGVFSFASLGLSTSKEGAYLVHRVSTMRSAILQEMADNYVSTEISQVPTTMPKKPKPTNDKIQNDDQ